MNAAGLLPAVAAALLRRRGCRLLWEPADKISQFDAVFVNAAVSGADQLQIGA